MLSGKRELKKEQGFTLMELIVIIVLLGIAVPAIFGLFSQISFNSAKNLLLDDMMAHCESRMEEIIAFKDNNWNWYNNPQQFAENVSLADNYTRTVTVTAINNWGSDNVSAWEITVNVSHPQIPNGYSLIVRLTQLRIQ